MVEFNKEASARARDEGIAAVSASSAEWLEQARLVARLICTANGTVCADDVRRSMIHNPAPKPNAWGAVFKSSDFEQTGEIRKSEAVSRHRGVQYVWRLK